MTAATRPRRGSQRVALALRHLALAIENTRGRLSIRTAKPRDDKWPPACSENTTAGASRCGGFAMLRAITFIQF